MLNHQQVKSINWKKIHGLIPCIIQNIYSSEVLMHGYMNQEALHITQQTKKVTFYSRTKERLWTKGEISGNFLNVINIILDCDQDSLLILVDPIQKTCHLNNYSCFNTYKTHYTNFYYLELQLKKRQHENLNNSYTFHLHTQGINRIAQKVGEEASEVVIAAINLPQEEIINETSDLIYHLLILLHHCNIDFNKIICNLNIRNENRNIK